MSNTGNKQAWIAYKVSVPGGVPLDINGEPISTSGRKQAIALLTGYSNPNPALYEVQEYFAVGGYLSGNPTQIYGADDCPVGFLRITPDTLVLSPAVPTGAFTIQSVNSWQLQSGPTTIATLVPTAAGQGTYTVSVTRSSTLGQGYFVFVDVVTGQTARIYIVNTTTPDGWILDTGIWDNLKFWTNTGIWNF